MQRIEKGAAISQGWEAELQLGFVRRGDKTWLAQRQHKGPLRVQRPFYPEGGLCHVYLLHPPGGVVAGDKLLIDVNVSEQAQALITTPAAGKFYRSEGERASQNVSLTVDTAAVLEWLPQETIVYQGARLSSHVKIDLFDDAQFIAWDILVLGRPASGERFDLGEALLNWQISRKGKPVYLEKMHLDAVAFMARWGLNKRSCCGTLFASTANKGHLEKIRSLIDDQQGLGVTLIDDLLICRASHDKTEVVRNFFENVRSIIRSDLVGRESYTPRIWAT